jgi:hypothetical protein
MTNYNPVSTNNRKVIRRPDGRVIATIENGRLTKRVLESRHLLLFPRGWAIDINAINQAKRLGIKWIHIIDRETGKQYRSTISNFMENSEIIDRGAGSQLVLPLPFWQVKRPSSTE